MDEFSDVPLRRDTSTSLPPTGPHRGPAGAWILAAIVVIAAGVATYVLFFQKPQPVRVASNHTTARPLPPPPPHAKALGPEVEPIALPALDQSDELVRTLVERLSRRPLILAFLGLHNSIRTFAAAALNISEGASPAPNLGPLRPKAPFSTIEQGGTDYIDPKAYHRYDLFADAARSIDATQAARLYSTLRPLLDQAYQDLGFPNQHFDDVVRRGIIRLLQTPTTHAPIAVRPKGALWQYADDRLEQLSPAQKQLVRMGPANAEIIKDKIREIALALGMPADSLPPR